MLPCMHHCFTTNLQLSRYWSKSFPRSKGKLIHIQLASIALGDQRLPMQAAAARMRTALLFRSWCLSPILKFLRSPPRPPASSMAVAGLPCFPLSVAAAAPAVQVAVWPDRRRPPAGHGEMDCDDGDDGALSRGRSVVMTATPGAAKPSVKGTSPSPIRLLDTEMCDVFVAYQGSPGTVIESVVLKAFSECIAVPHKRFEAALEAVESSIADIAILPIENSYSGSFHQNYDILLSHDLQIVQEVQMDVELCLLALPGVHKDDLKTIFSHPQYLAQCEHSVSNLSVSKKNVKHGAAGAEIISKQNLREYGVIGTARAAELYGLNILECNFQDESPNVTRYLVLAKTANLPKEQGQYKTSVVFGLEEGPGTLYKAIGVFWKRGINLTKIESRPNRGKPMRTRGTEKQFNYIFYVDFEASMAEVRAQNALKDIEVSVVSSAYATINKGVILCIHLLKQQSVCKHFRVKWNLHVSCVCLAAIHTEQQLPELLHQTVAVSVPPPLKTRVRDGDGCYFCSEMMNKYLNTGGILAVVPC